MVQTVERIKKMMPVLQASIPAAIKINIIADRTQTIRASISGRLQFTLLLTVVLVVMVIFAFLRSFRATVIPAITVPLSLIGTFAVLYELGYSLDNLSPDGAVHRCWIWWSMMPSSRSRTSRATLKPGFHLTTRP